MIVCAGDIESFKFATPIGIGLVNSAINLTRKCLLDKPESILFVGTAGSYGKHNILDIVESKKAANIELSFLEDNSYTPLNKIFESENSMCENHTIVNSSNYISKNFELSKKFNEFGIGCENMEYFSVLKVAREFEIPVAGVFCVTNYTNETAHEDFKKNHKLAMEKLTQYLLDKKLIK